MSAPAVGQAGYIWHWLQSNIGRANAENTGKCSGNKCKLQLTTLLNQIRNVHPDLKLNYQQIKNFDREDRIIEASAYDNKTFTGDGPKLVLTMKTHDLVYL